MPCRSQMSELSQSAWIVVGAMSDVGLVSSSWLARLARSEADRAVDRRKEMALSGLLKVESILTIKAKRVIPALNSRARAHRATVTVENLLNWLNNFLDFFVFFSQRIF